MTLQILHVRRGFDMAYAEADLLAYPFEYSESVEALLSVGR